MNNTTTNQQHQLQLLPQQQPPVPTLYFQQQHPQHQQYAPPQHVLPLVESNSECQPSMANPGGPLPFAPAQGHAHPTPNHGHHLHQPHHDPFLVLDYTLSTLPNSECDSRGWIAYDARVLNFLQLFATHIGNGILPERVRRIPHLLGEYAPDSAQYLVHDSYFKFCRDQKINAFPIQPLNVASFLFRVGHTQRFNVLQILEAARAKTSFLFDKLEFAPEIVSRFNPGTKGWILWERVAREGRQPLSGWTVIAQLIAPPRPTTQTLQLNQPRPQSQASTSRNSQPMRQPSRTTTPQGTPDLAISTGAKAVAVVTRKRARSPLTGVKLDPETAKAEIEFYGELDNLEDLIQQLALKRKARHQALAKARSHPTPTQPAPAATSTTISTPELASSIADSAVTNNNAGRILPSTSTSEWRASGAIAHTSGDGTVIKPPPFAAIPPAGPPPARPLARAMPSARAGITTSAFQSTKQVVPLPWSDYMPQTVPRQDRPGSVQPAPIPSPLELPGRRVCFAPSSVHSVDPATLRLMSRPSLRSVTEHDLPTGHTFASVQAGLSAAASGAFVLRKEPRPEQHIVPTQSNLAVNATAARPRPSLGSSATHHARTHSTPGPASALGVTGLPVLASSSINRPTHPPGARPSGSTGMGRVGSNGGGGGGRTPMLSGHNVHPLARLYGQISQTERKGVLQMVASRSPSVSQENSPRTGPPASLGASPLVKYVEMGIEIAEAAVKERMKGAAQPTAVQGGGLGLAMAGRPSGRGRMEELVAPPLVPVPNGQEAFDKTLPTSAADPPHAPPPLVRVPTVRASPIKNITVLRAESAEPEPELEVALPSSSLSPAQTTYAPPSSPSASPALLTMVGVYPTPGFPNRPADAAKRAGALSTRGLGPEHVRKGMMNMPVWVQRASMPAMPFSVSKK